MVQFPVNNFFFKEDDKEDEEDNIAYANYYFSILLLLHSSTLHELTVKETRSREMMILFSFSTHFDLQKRWFMFGCETLNFHLNSVYHINQQKMIWVTTNLLQAYLYVIFHDKTVIRIPPSALKANFSTPQI